MPAVLALLGPRIEPSVPAPACGHAGVRRLGGRGRGSALAVVAGALATAALLAARHRRPRPWRPGRRTSRCSPRPPGPADFERVATVMGPGWPTPYNIVVVSSKRPMTAPGCREIKPSRAASRAITRGLGRRPGRIRGESRDLKALPNGLKESTKLLKGGKRDLGRLERGLGRASDGPSQLRAGLDSAATGAGKLKGGPAPQLGAGKLRAGLVQARGGAKKITGGLARPRRRQRAQGGCRRGARRSQKIGSGLGEAAAPVTRARPWSSRWPATSRPPLGGELHAGSARAASHQSMARWPRCSQ